MSLVSMLARSPLATIAGEKSLLSFGVLNFGGASPSLAVSDATAMPVFHRTIPGFSQYIATSDGRIICKRGGRVVSMHTNDQGYLRVNVVSDSGKSTCLKVQHLICLAFHGVPSLPDMFAGFLDGDKTNVHISNIAWLTRKELLEKGRYHKARQCKDMDVAAATSEYLNAVAMLEGSSRSRLN